MPFITLFPFPIFSIFLKIAEVRKIIVYCRSGHRSVKASRILEENGFHPININGGIKEWKRNNLPVE
ncbi:MAG: rhodanese-like domain-containing protein [Epsilonproteobacteria bacterium]|nr:rhodanese-like domain-containing protein [Campylobacterota bacterium]